LLKCTVTLSPGEIKLA